MRTQPQDLVALVRREDITPFRLGYCSVTHLIVACCVFLYEKTLRLASVPMEKMQVQL